MSQEKKLVLFFAMVFFWMIVATRFSSWMGWVQPPKKPPVVAAGKDAKPDPGAVAIDAAAKADPRRSRRSPRQSKGRKRSRMPPKPRMAQPRRRPRRPPRKFRQNARSSYSRAPSWSSARPPTRVPGHTAFACSSSRRSAAVESVHIVRLRRRVRVRQASKTPARIHQPRPQGPPRWRLTVGKGAGFAKAPEVADDADDLDKADAQRRRGRSRRDARLRTLGSRPRKWPRRSPRDGEIRTPSSPSQARRSSSAPSPGAVSSSPRPSPVSRHRRLRGRAEIREPRQERSLVYHLLGPHGIPIEGIWYTGTFRDVFFGQLGQAANP